MAAFAFPSVWTAFEADLNAIFAKYAGEESDEFYLSEYLNGGKTTHSEDEGENSTADEKGDDDDDDDDDDRWDSDGSGPSAVDNFSCGSSMESAGSVLLRNQTFIVAKDIGSYSTENQERRDGKRKSIIKQDMTAEEKSQVEISLSQSFLIPLSPSDSQEHNCGNSENHVSDVTYVIDSDEGYASSRPLGSCDIYDKPASSASPTSSQGTQQKAFPSGEYCFVNKEMSSDPDTEKDLVQAVLCSRNKIAQALAGIAQKKRSRSSKPCSTKTTRPADRKIFASSECVRISCVLVDKMFESKVRDGLDSKASVTNSLGFEIENKDSNAPDTKKSQPVISSLDRCHPFVRRQSMKITSPPKTLQICNFDEVDMRSPPRRRKSTTLCQLNASGKSAHPVKNLEGCLEERKSPVTEAPTALSSNRKTPSAQYLVSPAHPSERPRTVRPRRSSLILTVKDGGSSNDSVEQREPYLESRSDRHRKCQVLKEAFHDKSDEVFEDVKKSPVANDKVRDYSQGVGESSSKRGISSWSCGDRDAKRNSSTQMISVPSQTKSHGKTGCCMIDAHKTNEQLHRGHAINNHNNLNRRHKVLEISSFPGTSVNKESLCSKKTVQLPSRIGPMSKAFRTVKLWTGSRNEDARKRIALMADLGSELSPSGCKKRTRESVVLDTPDSLPSKLLRTGCPLSTNLKTEPSVFGSESLSWQGRESTPIKGKNVKRLRTEEFSSGKMELLSPIRCPVAETSHPTQRVYLSPCKGKGSCDKSFCFKCP